MSALLNMTTPISIMVSVVMISALLVAGTLALSTSFPGTLTAIVTSPFIYSFNSDGILQEAGSLTESTSPYWWVNSGGELVISGNGQTMQGDAPATNKWRIAYAKANPLDTDNGLHPQNIFRLVTRGEWENVREQAQFYIASDELSASPNRNASNGLLFFNRYKDSQTLYYAGIRVDGTAVIKKKYHGTYYTMAQKAVFPGTYSGYQDAKNLLPHGQWIGLRTETKTNADGSVTMALFMQRPGETAWTQLLTATDTGQYAGTAPITGTGSEGIRTDFMDVQFRSFRLDTL